MGAVARRARSQGQQLALFATDTPGVTTGGRSARGAKALCEVCLAKEARYGFRDEDLFDRPGTLCFECFRLEITRRQAPAPHASRAIDAGSLPERSLQDRLEDADHRRRRAQIAARKALAGERPDRD